MNGNNPLLFDFAATRILDQRSIEAGLPEIQLMGQAALSSLHRLREQGVLDRMAEGGRWILLCGSGNNGGDGLALAYMLLGAHPRPRTPPLVFRTGESRSESSRFYASLLQKSGLPIRPAEEFLELPLKDSDLIVEALLGTGQKGELRSPMAELSARIREARSDGRGPGLLSLDLPAGLTEEGEVSFGSAERDLPAPDEIHSYGVEKLALRLRGDLASLSRIRTLPMGFLPEEQVSPERRLLLFTARPQPSFFLKKESFHKYEAGHALLIGGSPGMEGALLMAARSFFAAGGGILHSVVFAERSREFLTEALPSVMFSTPDRPEAKRISCSTVALGPGLSPEDLEKHRDFFLELLHRLLQASRDQEGPPPRIILDAGALPLILDSRYPAPLRARTLLTPHTGEWKRLGGEPVRNTRSLYDAMELNRERFGTFTLIKESVSVLLSPPGEEREGALFARPRASLAAAGSGDVLTGIFAAAFSRKRNEKTDLFRIAEQCLALHNEAAALRVHPRASLLPELTEELLGSLPAIEGRKGMREFLRGEGTERSMGADP